MDVSQVSPHVAKQRIALLLLKKFPEFKEETIAFLTAAKKQNGPWLQQNTETIDEVLASLHG